MLIKNPPVEITANLWMLGSGEYPLFLFKGETEGAIIEGGIGATGPLVCEQIEKLGIGGDFVKQLIVTHAHPDHVMAIPLLREIFPQATVSASSAAAKTLSFDKAVSFFSKIDAVLTASLLKAGLIDESHRPKPLAEMKIAVDRTIAQNDLIEVGGISIRVLETPGHSDCSLSFHESNGRVLVVSDATGFYMPEHDALWPCYFTGYAAYLESIERLAGLNAEILCLSHNGVITGADEVKAYFERAIATTREYHQRIVDDARAGKSAREIAGQLGSEIHEKTQLLPVDFFQKNCALMVKQSFRHEGISEEK